MNDGLLFVGIEFASLNIRPEVVCPSQPAALPTPLKTCYDTTQNARLLVELNACMVSNIFIRRGR